MRGDKVRPLVQEVDNKANEEIVEMLQSFVDLAKEGRIRSVAVAAIMTAEETRYGFHGAYRPIQLMGECTFMAMRIREKHVDPPIGSNMDDC